MIRARYWAGWAVVVVGLWEIFAPFALDYGNHFVMMINATVFGLLLVGFSLWQVATLVEWPSWVVLGLGTWLAVTSAFDAPLPRALVNQVIVGLLTIVLSGTTVLYARDVRACRQGLPSCRLT